MKFSELLGEPEPDPESDRPAPDAPAPDRLESDRPELGAEPISVFAAVPLVPPPGTPPVEPPASDFSGLGGRSGLAELNVRQPAPEVTEPVQSSVSDQLLGLTEIVDDLLPSARRRGK